MNRVTKKMLNNAFENYCRTLGKRVSTGYKDVSAWFIEARPACYGGGYRIAEQLENGGITYPITMSVFTARELLAILNFALMSIKQYQDPQNQSAWAWPVEMLGKE